MCKTGCENGIASVKKHSPYDENYDRKKSTNEQYYFNLKASNGEVIGTSETYTTSKWNRKWYSIGKDNAPTAPIEDLT
jgi:uncharacterized protein YegP (UPF0339 family)